MVGPIRCVRMDIFWIARWHVVENQDGSPPSLVWRMVSGLFLFIWIPFFEPQKRTTLRWHVNMTTVWMYSTIFSIRVVLFSMNTVPHILQYGHCSTWYARTGVCGDATHLYNSNVYHKWWLPYSERKWRFFRLVTPWHLGQIQRKLCRETVTLRGLAILYGGLGPSSWLSKSRNPSQYTIQPWRKPIEN